MRNEKGNTNIEYCMSNVGNVEVKAEDGDRRSEAGSQMVFGLLLSALSFKL
jgi:hypothetical protein